MSDCGLTNLGSCLVEKFFEFLHSLLNAPITPLLNFVKDLLTEPVSIELFKHIWVIIIYVLSMFYGLLIVYTGFRFILTANNPMQREKSKQTLKNVIVMIILVQASYFCYELLLDIGSMLTTPVINMINPSFFQLTVDNLINLGLEILFGLGYVFILLLTAILLMLRYALVSVGVVLFPVGIFLYFIEPVRSYGKLILNFLGVNMFVTFFISLILLAFSKLLMIGFFQNIKILVMITAFVAVNWTIFKSFTFSMTNAAQSASKYIVKAVKYLAL